jgi:prepilin-type N-terminal cleavage/methylation domain-containing protein
MLSRIRKAAHRSDKGMTLVELLVSTMLLTIVIGLATGALIVVLDKQSNISQASDAANQNQTAMELLSRVIRQGVYPTGSSTTSTIIQSGSSTNQLVITSRLSSTSDGNDAAGTTTARLGAQISKYTFTLTGTTLSWQKADLSSCTSSTCTYGTATAQKVLIRGVRNSSGASACSTNSSTDGPFHYVTLDASSNPVSPALSTPASSALGTIAYVTVNLFTQTQTGPQKPSCTLLSDYVELRNKS